MINHIKTKLSARVAKHIENRDVGKTSRYNSTEVESLEVTEVANLPCLILIHKPPPVRVAKRIEKGDVGNASRYNPTEVGSLEVTVVDVSRFVLISIRKTILNRLFE